MPNTARYDCRSISVRAILSSPISSEEIKRQLRVSGARPLPSCTLELTERHRDRRCRRVIAKMTRFRLWASIFPSTTSAPGYSSLAYIKRLPIHELKIDKSFIQDCTTIPTMRRWSKPSCPSPSTCNFHVVAEGVVDTSTGRFPECARCRHSSGLSLWTAGTGRCLVEAFA